MADRVWQDTKGDEHEVDFDNTAPFALGRWQDAILGVELMQTKADWDKINEPREWQTVHTEIRQRNAAKTTLPAAKKLLNGIQPLPRSLNDLVTHFASAIKPLEANYNVLWGLLDLNIELSCTSSDKLKRTAGWLKKLRSVIELFNRCLSVCDDDINEARIAMADVLEYVLQVLAESASHLRNCPTDAEASRGWAALHPKINDSLVGMETTVRHLNDITSYSRVNLERQIKNLELRHAPFVGPEEYSTFPISMLPRPANPDFYGRQDELERIDHYLNFKDAAYLLRTFTIYGRRGVGKTDIALKYAHTNSAGFDAIFWVQCETSITLRQSFTDIAVALNLPGADRNGHHEENQLAVIKWLKTTKRQWLLIFDNAERESILRGYWPVGASGAILTTSRKYYNFTFDAQRKGETVKVFTAEQSWDLLMKLLGPDWQDRDRLGQMKSSEDRVARELLNSLGGLALAIQQAAQLIKNPDIGGSTIASTYTSFKEHKETLPDRQSGDRSDIFKSLDTLWSMTFSSLSRNARDLLSVLSLLSPDGILIDLFLPRNQKALDGKLSFCKQHPDHVDATSNVTLSNVIRAPARLQLAIDELLKFKLIKREGREISAHRVVQEAMNYHSLSELQQYFNSAAALVYEAFPKQMNGDYLTKEQRGACLSYISHAAHLSLQYSRYHRAAAKGTLQGSPEFVKLLYNAAWYLYEVSDYDICVLVVQTAWLACDDKESLSYAELCNVAAAAYLELNKLDECRRNWVTTSEIHEKLLSENDIDRSTTYHNMGNLELATGNFDEAVEYLNKAIAIRLEHGDAAGSLLANSYLCLARAHAIRQEYETAFTILGQSEALFFRIAGADAHFMAHVHYAYGNLDFAQKRWASAKRCFETSLRIGLATAAIHPITAAAYYSLGCVEFEQNHLEKSRGFLDKALAIAQLRSPSRDDGTMARILWKKSVVLGDDVTGTYQKEADELRIRADLALRKLSQNGEGSSVVTIDDEGNAEWVETEDSYDALVPVFFR